MRADRLLRLLNALQAQGRATAVELAALCGVSLRTIYRDMETLSTAGIPIYAERGALGGYRLLEGHRTRLNGLSPQEAELLFLSGLPAAATDLGMGNALRGAQDKLLAALPAPLRDSGERMRGRFHHDAPAWFAQAEQPPQLPLVADAVWRQLPLRMRYRSWKGEKDRIVEPLGLVLKSGDWYLVARVEASVRTYRVARIDTAQLLDTPFERPVAFNLGDYWRNSTQRLQQELHAHQATVRLSPQALAMLDTLLPIAASAMKSAEARPDADGWRVLTIPVGKATYACLELLRFGTELEVLDPPELREEMARTVRALAARYLPDG